MSDYKGWIGVDLDGTLAEYGEWQGATHIGNPIPKMVARVKNWLNLGYEIRIFTARVYHDGRKERWEDAYNAQNAIQDWCLENIGVSLRVTCQKDYDMLELWDDRAVQVERNTGEIVGKSTRGLTEVAG